VPDKLRKRRFMLGAFLFLASTILLGLSLGTVPLPPKDIFKVLMAGPGFQEIPGLLVTTSREIVWNLRFPRVCLAFLEGASLSVAGVVMQGLFRNPMADPYVLGVSSGASLGAVLGITLGIGRALGLWALPALAFLGALGSTGLVYVLSSRNGRVDTWTLLLSGIAVSSLISSLIAFMMVFFRERLDEIVFWTMGGLSRATWGSVFWAALYGVPGLYVIWRVSPVLNALSFGEEPAFHMGVPVETAKRTLLWISALITASGVAFSGPIGFVGLIVPHAVRLVAGPDARWLVPLSTLVGGSFLILADLLARTLVPPLEIPVGVLTALSGAPFFLYLLKRHPRGGVE